MKNERLPSAFFTQIPKAELHCHLDGSLRESTLHELAKVKHVTIPSAFFGQIHASLEKYLERFSVICAVMQTRESIYRAAYELVEDGARENIWHMEARFCPTLLVGEGLSLDEITQAAIDGGNDAARKYGVSYGVILSGIRLFKPSVNLEIAKVAVRFKDRGVIGYDLAGPEEGYPAKEHAEAFVHVLSHYMNTTVHAGESYGPDSIEQSLVYCGAQRIGHGTRLFERPDLLHFVVNKRIPLEVCLTSNEQTGAVASVAKHPLPQYLEAGVRASLCTDNRLVSGINLSGEYERAHLELGLGYPELKTLSVNGFKSAFIPHRQKGELLKKVNARWREIEKEFHL